MNYKQTIPVISGQDGKLYFLTFNSIRLTFEIRHLYAFMYVCELAIFAFIL